MARILWRDAQGKEGSVDVAGGEIRIGRAMDCAIRTEDAMVSRHHARLYWAGGQYFLEDLGSANGVFYQEQRVARHPLKHGDAVRCGSLWLRFVDEANSPSPPPTGGYRPPSGAIPAHMQPDPGSQPSPITPQPGPAQMSPSPSPPARNDDADEEIRILRRRVEQLQTELRLYRGGKGSEVARKIEELENDNASLTEQNGKLERQVAELEDRLQVESSDVKSRWAEQLATRTSELVQQLNDILSNLRINVMAAGDEFEQFSNDLPRASFELIREALRSASGDADTARDLLRNLRDAGD